MKTARALGAIIAMLAVVLALAGPVGATDDQHLTRTDSELQQSAVLGEEASNVAVQQTGADSLPVTGGDALGIMVMSVVVLAGGAALVALSRLRADA